jgi:hypothetical protein
MPTPFPPASLARLQESFVAVVLPRVLSHGRVYFRGSKCPHRQEDAIQEMVCLAWKWHVRLAEKGKDATRFPTALATYAARAVRSGRRLAGHERSKDVLSPVAKRKHGFALERLPDFSTLGGNPIEEALFDNRVSPVLDQVAFRLDFPAWRLTHADRDRRLIDHLMLGGRTLEASRAFGLSPARISQKRREFHDSWQAFCGDASPADPPRRSRVP